MRVCACVRACCVCAHARMCVYMMCVQCVWRVCSVFVVRAYKTITQSHANSNDSLTDAYVGKAKTHLPSMLSYSPTHLLAQLQFSILIFKFCNSLLSNTQE